MSTTQAALLEALTDLASAVSSLNSGPSHAIQVNGERVYWQREEWVRWILNEKLPEARAAIAQAEAAALSAADAAQPEPVGYVNASALEWLAGPDRGENAHIQVGIFKTPGGACDAPIYRAAPQPPAPIAAQADDARLKPTKAERVHALVNAGPFPGMSEAFDTHMGAACWADHAYRQDAATWAAAWKAALAAQAGPALVPLTDEQMDRARIDAGIAASNVMWDILKMYGRAIERAHGIGAQAPESTRPADASIPGQRIDTVQWRSPDDTESVPHLVWLREGSSVFLGYYFVQPFREYRDADGFYTGQQDAEEYWARYDDGDRCEPDGWCELQPPALAAAPQAPAEQQKPIDNFAVGLGDTAGHNSGDTTAYRFSDGNLVEVKPGESFYRTPVAPAEPAAQAVSRGEPAKEDTDYPRDFFAAMIENGSPYAFYLFQWVPYHTDARRWRLKMLHDVRTFDGREAFGIWPNGQHCGPFRDDEVEFIRISRKQWCGEWQDPRPTPAAREAGTTAEG